MSSFNKVILLGNLTRDPEMRTTPSGLSIAKLGLAVNRSYSTRDGERKEEVTFIDVDAFGKQAEAISKYLKKGSPLMMEGRLKLDQWEGQSGEKRSKLSVVLESFQFIGGASGGSSNPNSPKRDTGSGQSSAPVHDSGDSSDFDEDVPF